MYCSICLEPTATERERKRGRDRPRKDEGWGTSPPSIPVQPAPDCQKASVKPGALMMACQMQTNEILSTGPPLDDCAEDTLKDPSYCSSREREKLSHKKGQIWQQQQCCPSAPQSLLR